jgi:hypothetical protein
MIISNAALIHLVLADLYIEGGSKVGSIIEVASNRSKMSMLYIMDEYHYHNIMYR